jgi:hypothetical protein
MAPDGSHFYLAHTPKYLLNDSLTVYNDPAGTIFLLNHIVFQTSN